MIFYVFNYMHKIWPHVKRRTETDGEGYLSSWM
jgi:hypothetical protein